MSRSGRKPPGRSVNGSSPMPDARPAAWTLSLLIGLGAAAEVPVEEDATDWPTMISRLQQQVQQRPGHAQSRQQLATAYNNYGVSLGHQQAWELAARQLQEALQLDEGNPQYQQNLGNIYLNQTYALYQGQRLEEALASVNQAIAVAPDSAQAYALLGEIEYARQRLKEAKAAWQRAVELDPSQGSVAKRLAQVTEELPRSE